MFRGLGSRVLFEDAMVPIVHGEWNGKENGK